MSPEASDSDHHLPNPFALAPDALKVRFTHHPRFLEAEVTGFKSPVSVSNVLARIGAVMRDAGLQRVLIDATHVVGEMSATDHAAIGAAVAHHLGAVRCAVVARPDRPRGEIAPSAQAGGVDYHAFDDRPAAVAWLELGS
jgi:hypothetical protein